MKIDYAKTLKILIFANKHKERLLDLSRDNVAKNKLKANKHD